MPRTLVTILLQPASGIPSDVAINTYAVDIPTPITNSDLRDAFFAFYSNISDYISGTVERTGNSGFITLTDIDDPEPRVPYYADALGVLSPHEGFNVPSELAVCLSLRTPTGSGDVPARHRGRVYIGPLSSEAIEVPTSDAPARVLPAFVTSLTSAASTLRADISALGDSFWCVWSRVDDNFREVSGGWVDNAFDIQRRRGELATLRTNWS